MKSILLLLIASVVLCLANPADAATLRGQVVDIVTGNPVSDANVTTNIDVSGGSTNMAGRFAIERVEAGQTVTLLITHIGYRDVNIEIVVGSESLTIEMVPVFVQRSEVFVTAGRGVQGKESGTLSNIARDQLEMSYGAQDVPLLTAGIPSVTAFSWSGSSVGAATMKIRGFDQTRLGITVNGIPINDPEDHDVYWQDTPDFLTNTYDIQLERGVSSFLSGPAGLGGGVNLATGDVISKRELTVSLQGGKFNTRRHTLAYRSGLIDGTYNFTGRFSDVSTDGYRDHTAAETWSYFLAAARFDPNMITRLQVYGGQEEMDAYWWGVDRATLESDRTYNLSANYGLNYDGERDFFQQPHYVLHNQWRLTPDIDLNQSLFWIEGDGYYEEYKSGRKFAEYNISPFDRIFDEDGDGDLDTVTISRTDLIRRKYVEKNHYGWLPRLNWTVGPMTNVDLGLEIRFFHADHYGRVMWARELSEEIDPQHEWYRWDCEKNYLGGYANVEHRINDRLTVNSGIQIRQISYSVDQEQMGAFAGYEYELDWLFVNPRLGATYQLNDRTNFYTSLAMAGREPVDSQIYDADNPDDIPKLSKYDQDEIDPERMLDIEIGGLHNYGDLEIGANLYAMLFTDEIITTGFSSNRDEEIYDNAPTSRHIGIEIEGSYSFSLESLLGREDVTVSGNVCFGQATLGDYDLHYVAYDDDWNLLADTTLNLKGNRIAGFPDITAGLRTSAVLGRMRSSLQVQYVGKQYMDNREDDDAALDPYIVLDGSWLWQLLKFQDGGGITLEMRIMNLLDYEYEPYGVVDVEYGTPYYVPAAGRHYLAGITLKL
ncbi:MAG: TonB-dependent receptor [Candidatus Electryoneaceae bacterium]|nr:TonB-dependent receptor [Candidatus Electryoneaceae bacterium]